MGSIPLLLRREQPFIHTTLYLPFPYYSYIAQMSFNEQTLTTQPISGQKPGTSGLRKKTVEFMAPNYLENFVQATFTALKESKGEFDYPTTLLIGGDGRYYCVEAAKIIVRLAAANGVSRVWVAKNALLSTPAASAVIRNRRGGGDESVKAGGAFILTASHNSGGLKEDFGIKYNGSNGGPAPEKLTNVIFDATTSITSYKIAEQSLDDLWDISVSGTTTFKNSTTGDAFEIEVIDPVEDYAKLLASEVFDFELIKKFLHSRSDFRVLVDGLSGIAGPYIQKVFVDILQVGSNVVIENSTPLADFGGGHPDPNLTYAKNLVAKMGLNRDGTPADNGSSAVSYDFGVAFDGDADRNMILGRQFFVSPSDSVAIIAANADAIPFFSRAGGLKAVARSMPASGALDFVAKAKGIHLSEVPTGWKFFGNLMDSKVVYGKEDYTPMICGEESFGTGSNHVREKDGLWAALAWLSIIAAHNSDPSKPLVGVQQIVEKHWCTYGRNYYSRYDYENITSEAAASVMKHVATLTPASVPALSTPCVQCDSFSYTDPVDGSVTKNQGLRIIFEDQSRFVLRESGTGSSGATLRLYMEQYLAPSEVAKALHSGSLLSTAKQLESMVALALSQTKMEELTGRSAPTVIT
eukprot:GILI01017356.1.p1 GENE.GILI01017356.1~~GILI01017356.1.p1  ORF type:complete len:637 (+),score=162.11 GILI01017356.1:54-1964(+)